jgi:hypothetical protein
MTPRAEQTLGLISRKHRLTPVLSFVDRALNLDLEDNSYRQTTREAESPEW